MIPGAGKQHLGKIHPAKHRHRAGKVRPLTENNVKAADFEKNSVKWRKIERRTSSHI